MTESEAWDTAEDGLERRDNTQVLVACDRLQEAGFEAEASALRWYLKKGLALFYLSKTNWSAGLWELFDGDPYEDGTDKLGRFTSFKKAVQALAQERRELQEQLSD